LYSNLPSYNRNLDGTSRYRMTAYVIVPTLL
jgi:hypothetical protein